MLKKNINESKYLTQQKTTTTEIHAPDLGQTHTYRMWLG